MAKNILMNFAVLAVAFAVVTCVPHGYGHGSGGIEHGSYGGHGNVKNHEHNQHYPEPYDGGIKYPGAFNSGYHDNNHITRPIEPLPVPSRPILQPYIPPRPIESNHHHNHKNGGIHHDLGHGHGSSNFDSHQHNVPSHNGGNNGFGSSSHSHGSGFDNNGFGSSSHSHGSGFDNNGFGSSSHSHGSGSGYGGNSGYKNKGY